MKEYKYEELFPLIYPDYELQRRQERRRLCWFFVTLGLISTLIITAILVKMKGNSYETYEVHRSTKKDFCFQFEKDYIDLCLNASEVLNNKKFCNDFFPKYCPEVMEIIKQDYLQEVQVKSHVLPAHLAVHSKTDLCFRMGEDYEKDCLKVKVIPSQKRFCEEMFPSYCPEVTYFLKKKKKDNPEKYWQDPKDKPKPTLSPAILGQILGQLNQGVKTQTGVDVVNGQIVRYSPTGQKVVDKNFPGIANIVGGLQSLTNPNQQQQQQQQGFLFNGRKK